MDTSLSMKKELELIRPFTARWFHFPIPKDYYTDNMYSPKARNYTEQEIQETEERLQFKLATPIRELYLYMADLIIDDGLVPLEYLRWDRNYLAIFITPGDCWANGLYRFDDPNAMYVWEDEWPEDWPEYCDSLMESQDRYEHYCKLGDEAGRKAALKDYYYYLEQVDYGDVTKPNSLIKLTDEPRFNHALDAYGLFRVIETLLDNISAINRKLGDNEHLYFLSERFPSDPEEEKQFKEKVERYFIPLSEHHALIEDYNSLLRAYITPDGTALLLQQSDVFCFTLVPQKPVTFDFAEDIARKSGLSFKPGIK